MWKQWEVEYMRLNYGILPIEDIANKLGKTENAVIGKIHRSGIKMNNRRKEFAIYRGDNLLVIGTEKECADLLGIDIQTLRFYRTPSYEKRIEISKPDDMMYVVDLGYWPINEEAYHETLEQINFRI